MAVGWAQDAATLGAYAADNSLDWVFSEAPTDLPRDYAVRSQSTKIGIGADGTIVFRKDKSTNDASFWRGVLEQLRGQT